LVKGNFVALKCKLRLKALACYYLEEKKMKKLLCLIVFAALVSSAFGASITVKWTGTASDDWGTASNWDLNRVPRLSYAGGNKGDYVWVNYLATRPEGATIYSDAQKAYAVYVMREGVDDNTKTAILNLRGGSLSICDDTNGGELKLGLGTASYYAAHPQQPLAVVNMYDGFTLNVNSTTGGTTIGDYYDGVFNMYGGVYNENSGAFRISNNAYNGGLGYANGTLNLYDGQVNIYTWNAALGQADLRDFTPKSKINVGDGFMTLVGDSTARLQAYANQGLIQAMPGYTLAIEYDPSIGARGTTFLSAVPEPATVLLLGLGGLLLRKRK
jgi:hypothetical protein